MLSRHSRIADASGKFFWTGFENLAHRCSTTKENTIKEKVTLSDRCDEGRVANTCQSQERCRASAGRPHHNRVKRERQDGRKRTGEAFSVRPRVAPLPCAVWSSSSAMPTLVAAVQPVVTKDRQYSYQYSDVEKTRSCIHARMRKLREIW